MKTTTKFPKMVERMREIRDEVSHDIMNMSLEEEKAYITEQLNKLKNKRSMTSDSVNSPE
tara:strand:- start:108 stop:287 length:180 start_codon:yes stop_codon:yes gene_type:complete